MLSDWDIIMERLERREAHLTSGLKILEDLLNNRAPEAYMASEGLSSLRQESQHASTGHTTR